MDYTCCTDPQRLTLQVGSLNALSAMVSLRLENRGTAMLRTAALRKVGQLITDTHLRLTELTLVTRCMIFVSVHQYKRLQIMTHVDLVSLY